MTDAATKDGAGPVLVKERRGAVQVLRLNRPDARNSLNPALLTAIGLSMTEAENDPDVRAVVLTGTGDKAFCAGMDLRAFAEGGAVGGDPEGMKGFGRFTQGEIGVPIVGAANATAVAGGFELLLGCDVVVASEAALFGVPEVKRSLVAGAGGALLLAQRVPRALALELLLTGDPIDARRAAEIGLVNRVVEEGQALAAAVELAEKIAANGPLALMATKEIAHRGGDWTAAQRWDEAARLMQPVFTSQDAQEGARAFAEKRAPVWKGK